MAQSFVCSLIVRIIVGKMADGIAFRDVFEEETVANAEDSDSCNEENNIQTEDYDYADDESYIFSIDDAVFKVETENMGEYIENWRSQGQKLYIRRIDDVKNAFNKFGPVGLFRLFLTNSFFRALLHWTNIRLAECGKKTISEAELNAYVGLELAMSISEQNAIEDYWSTKAFLGVKGFNDVMARNQFTAIRSAITFRPPGLDTPDVKHSDPLWHSRGIMKELLTNCMAIASASGVLSLDEASIRTRAKCRAKSYIPSKPDKYAIRLYAMNCWNSLYLQNFFDNGAGNSGSLNCSERYVQLFPKLRTLFLNHIKKFEQDSMIHGMERNKQSWLWSLQMAPVTQQHRSGERRRLVVTDNYYTRPGLARAVNSMSDGEIRMIGTCRTTFVGAPNRKNIELALAKLKNSPRGSWILVAEHEEHHDCQKLRKEHEKAMNKLPSSARTAFITPLGNIVEKSGFVIFMDKRPVIVYTNDLAYTMMQTFMESDNENTVRCVHGLVLLRRWTKTESIFRTEFLAPAIFVAYNIFMNGVDRMDQVRVANPSRRCEKRVSMSIFTWALDIACNNALSILKTLFPDRIWNMRNFKREISMALVRPLQMTKASRKVNTQQHKIQTPLSFPEMNKIIGSDASKHYMLKNKNGQMMQCFVCKILSGKRLRSAYSCVECGKGYHVDCFTAIHFQHALSQNRVLQNKLLKALNASKAIRGRKSNNISTLSALVLECEKDSK